jgi:hypothetical protein
MTDPSISFRAAFRLSDEELVVSYEVHNRSERDLYLLNLILEGPAPRLDPNVIYVHLERDEKTIWLNKMIPAVPEGAYTPKTPLSTPLRAGATFREEVHIPVPVKEHREDAPDRWKGEPRLVTYKRVYFTLQYYWRTEGMREEHLDLDGLRVLVTRGGTPLKESDFGLLESEQVEIAAPVLERGP